MSGARGQPRAWSALARITASVLRSLRIGLVGDRRHWAEIAKNGILSRNRDLMKATHRPRRYRRPRPHEREFHAACAAFNEAFDADDDAECDARHPRVDKAPQAHQQEATRSRISTGAARAKAKRAPNRAAGVCYRAPASFTGRRDISRALRRRAQARR